MYENKSYYKSDVTFKIIKCAQKVHSAIGCGFQEIIYQRALKIELTNNGLISEREKEVPIYYNGLEIGSRRVDFIIDNDIIVELKSLSKLENVHFAQAINYIEAYNMAICLLINFGAKNLEVRRFIGRNKGKQSILSPSA